MRSLEKSLRKAAPLTALTCIAVAALGMGTLLAGCGGGSGTSASAGALTPATSRVVVSFRWPEIPTDDALSSGRAIPLKARFVRIQVQQSVSGKWNPIQQQTLQRPEGTAATAQLATFENIPRIPGKIRLSVQAFATQPGSGTGNDATDTEGSLASVLSTFTSDDDFKKAETASLSMTLASTVTRLEVQRTNIQADGQASGLTGTLSHNAPANEQVTDPLDVTVTDHVLLSVIPRDANGSIVLIDPKTELTMTDGSAGYIAVTQNQGTADFDISAVKRSGTTTPALTFTQKNRSTSADSLTVMVPVVVRSLIKFTPVQGGQNTDPNVVSLKDQQADRPIVLTVTAQTDKAVPVDQNVTSALKITSSGNALYDLVPKDHLAQDPVNRDNFSTTFTPRAVGVASYTITAQETVPAGDSSAAHKTLTIAVSQGTGALILQSPNLATGGTLLQGAETTLTALANGSDPGEILFKVTDMVTGTPTVVVDETISPSKTDPVLTLTSLNARRLRPALDGLAHNYMVVAVRKANPGAGSASFSLSVPAPSITITPADQNIAGRTQKFDVQVNNFAASKQTVTWDTAGVTEGVLGSDGFYTAPFAFSSPSINVGATITLAADYDKTTQFTRTVQQTYTFKTAIVSGSIQ